MSTSKKQMKIGYFCGFASSILWGILPVYWKTLSGLNSFAVMFYRLVLAFVFVLILCAIIYGKKGILEPFKTKGSVKTFFFAGLIISINWSMYIWAVGAGHIVQTSIGYYIDPIFICIIGILIFHEKVNKYKVTAIVLACIGVSVMVLSYGKVPLVALGVASTFALYAAIKRYLRAPALIALLYETGLMLPIVIPVIIYFEVNGIGIIGNATSVELGFLSLAGIVTAVPLLLFALAANRINMVTLGVIGYLSPSLGLALGVLLYHEPFDLFHIIGFVIIWAGLFVFTLGEIKESSKLPT